MSDQVIKMESSYHTHAQLLLGAILDWS